MSRFNVHAPWVRRLTINLGNMYRYENLDGLHSISRTATLLPTLTEVTYTHSRDSSLDIFDWISMFLSPSLSSIRSGNVQNYAWYMPNSALDLDLSVALLSDISGGCPNLELLEIYPLELTDKNDDDIASRPSLIADFTSYISTFAHLRTLSSTTIVLEPGVFLALGKLPHLESLTLHPNIPDKINTALALPEDAFPSLRHLHLSMMENMISGLCGLKPLVRQLTALKITLQSVHAGFNPIPRGVLGSDLGILVKNNAILSSLEISADGSRFVQINRELIECFRHFPLRFLSLDFQTFESGAGLKALLEALPAVEELHLGYSDFLPHYMQDLRLFASHTRLPHLRVLELPVQFSHRFHQEESDSAEIPCHQPQSYIQLRSTFRDIGKDENRAQPVAR